MSFSSSYDMTVPVLRKPHLDPIPTNRAAPRAEDLMASTTGDRPGASRTIFFFHAIGKVPPAPTASVLAPNGLLFQMQV